MSSEWGSGLGGGPGTVPGGVPAGGAGTRHRYVVELLLVAALSLGQSATYAVVQLIDMSTRGPISEARAQLNTSVSPRPWFDLTYQLLGIGFTLVPVALALWFMLRDRDIDPTAGPLVSRLGLGHAGGSKGLGSAGFVPSWLSDTACALGLFVVIGVGTLAVYFVGRASGITASIQPNNLGAYWWTVPVLMLQAVKNGVLEEVLLLGFGVDRLRKLRVSAWVMIVGLAVFRGSYHLYQGWGPFVGNVLMGVVFGYLYVRGPHLTRGRLLVFVLTHSLIDTVGFLAPGVLAAVDPR